MNVGGFNGHTALPYITRCAIAIKEQENDHATNLRETLCKLWKFVVVNWWIVSGPFFWELQKNGISLLGFARLRLGKSNKNTFPNGSVIVIYYGTKEQSTSNKSKLQSWYHYAYNRWKWWSSIKATKPITRIPARFNVLRHLSLLELKQWQQNPLRRSMKSCLQNIAIRIP